MVLRRFFLNTLILFKMQVALYRFLGLFTAIVAVLVPLGTLFLILFTSGSTSEEHAYLLLAGNIVVSLVNTCITSLGQYIGNMKEARGFEFYATLPVSKLSLVLALMCSNIMLSLPGFIAVGILGWLILGIQISIGPGFFLAVILTAATMASIGTMIGVTSKTGQQANHISLVAMFVFIFLAPVYYQIESLPLVLQWWGRIQPVTYGANAIRAALAGLPVSVYLGDLIILLALATVSLTIVTKGIKWREG